MLFGRPIEDDANRLDGSPGGLALCANQAASVQSSHRTARQLLQEAARASLVLCLKDRMENIINMNIHELYGERGDLLHLASVFLSRLSELILLVALRRLARVPRTGSS